MRHSDKCINRPHILSSVSGHSDYYCYLGLVCAVLCSYASLIYPSNWTASAWRADMPSPHPPGKCLALSGG